MRVLLIRQRQTTQASEPRLELVKVICWDILTLLSGKSTYEIFKIHSSAWAAGV